MSDIQPYIGMGCVISMRSATVPATIIRLNKDIVTVREPITKNEWMFKRDRTGAWREAFISATGRTSMHDNCVRLRLGEMAEA
jgi:hypothetical protein